MYLPRGDRLPRVEGRALNCSGWSGALAIASLEDFDHLFLPALRFWNGTLVGANQTARHTGPVVELANFVQRMMAPWDHVLSVERTEVLKYWEANILGAAKFPDTVQFIIGHFPTLFGSALGDALREWCERRGWVLVWALGVPRPVHGSMDDHWTTPLPYNRRVLDAVVLRRVAVVNATEIASESAVDAFSQQWEVSRHGHMQLLHRSSTRMPLQCCMSNAVGVGKFVYFMLHTHTHITHTHQQHRRWDPSRAS
eukprot:m.260083 g.260083  ORF g.260083 m.260083 type:complete len:254 (+) comp19674_c0_seq4:137-898(+)